MENGGCHDRRGALESPELDLTRRSGLSSLLDDVPMAVEAHISSSYAPSAEATWPRTRLSSCPWFICHASTPSEKQSTTGCHGLNREQVWPLNGW